jgi:hypothetical protein
MGKNKEINICIYFENVIDIYTDVHRREGQIKCTIYNINLNGITCTNITTPMLFISIPGKKYTLCRKVVIMTHFVLFNPLFKLLLS